MGTHKPRDVHAGANTETLLTSASLVRRPSPLALEAQAQNNPRNTASSWLHTFPRGSSATICLLPPPWSIICEASWRLLLTFWEQGLGANVRPLLSVALAPGYNAHRVLGMGQPAAAPEKQASGRKNPKPRDRRRGTLVLAFPLGCYVTLGKSISSLDFIQPFNIYRVRITGPNIVLM